MRIFLVILGLVSIMLVPVAIFDDEIDALFGGAAGLERLQSYGSWAWLA